MRFGFHTQVHNDPRYAAEYPVGHSCSFVFANSFDNGDGISTAAQGLGLTKADAETAACKDMVAKLFIKGARMHKRMVLHQNAWTVPIQDLWSFVEDSLEMTPAPAGMAAPPPHIPQQAPPQGQPLASAPPPQVPDPRDGPLTEAQRIQSVVNICRRASEYGDFGWKAPENMWKSQWKALDRLIRPGTLKTFLENQPEFQVRNMGGKKWEFKYM